MHATGGPHFPEASWWDWKWLCSDLAHVEPYHRPLRNQVVLEKDRSRAIQSYFSCTSLPLKSPFFLHRSSEGFGTSYVQNVQFKFQMNWCTTTTRHLWLAQGNHHQVCLVAPTYYSWMIATRVEWKLPNDIFIDGNLLTPKFDPSANKARADNFFYYRSLLSTCFLALCVRLSYIMSFSFVFFYFVNAEERNRMLTQRMDICFLACCARAATCTVRPSNAPTSSLAPSFFLLHVSSPSKRQIFFLRASTVRGTSCFLKFTSSLSHCPTLFPPWGIWGRSRSNLTVSRTRSKLKQRCVKSNKRTPPLRHTGGTA